MTKTLTPRPRTSGERKGEPERRREMKKERKGRDKDIEMSGDFRF
jgi:hypothetical protein